MLLLNTQNAIPQEMTHQYCAQKTSPRSATLNCYRLPFASSPLGRSQASGTYCRPWSHVRGVFSANFVLHIVTVGLATAAGERVGGK
jgi:hypothetical protein